LASFQAAVILNQAKRRRILQALLPLLAVVWAGLPALPCCHELGAGSRDHAVETVAAEHDGHHGSQTVADEFVVDHGANHCEEGSVTNIDPPCTDIQKTANDVRPVHFVAALVVVASILPAPNLVSMGEEPIPDPSPPPRRRPLHLEKSVLLI
jgi:hypothetical protein